MKIENSLIEERSEKLKELKEQMKKLKLQFQLTTDEQIEVEELNNFRDNLNEKLNKINKDTSLLENERDDLILKILGQLHKGCIGELSFREGGVYRYKARYTPLLTEIKNSIERNLHNLAEVISKKNPRNLDILEYLLKKIGECKKEYKPFNPLSDDDDDEKRITLNKPLFILNDDFSNVEEVIFVTIKGSHINFLNKDEIGVYGLDDIEENLILFYCKDEIYQIVEKYEAKLKQEEDLIKKDIEEIKESCKDIVMLLALKSESEGIK